MHLDQRVHYTYMRLHLPTQLRKALLAVLAIVGISAGSATATVLTSDGVTNVYGDMQVSGSHANIADGYASHNTPAAPAGSLMVNYAAYNIGSSATLSAVTTENGSVLTVNGSLTSTSGISLNGGATGTHTCTDPTTYYVDDDGTSHYTHYYGHTTSYPHAAGTLVTGTMTAVGNIDIDSQTTIVGTNNGGNMESTAGNINMDNADVTVYGTQEATRGTISAEGTDLTVTGNQIAGGENDGMEQPGIKLTDSTATIDGGQYALEGGIQVTGSSLSIGDGQIANEGIALEDSSVTIGSNQIAEGENTQDKHIVVSNSTLVVDGDQKAQEGSIYIVGTMDGEGSTVDGNQIAREDILLLGTEAKIGGTQTAETGSITVTGSTLTVGTDVANLGTDKENASQTAKQDISITAASKVTIAGDQTAETGSIEVDSSLLSVGGNQTAGTNINIANGSTATIDGNQTAEAGYISVADSTLTVGGDQQAETNIAMQNATVDITGSQTAVTGSISATNSSQLSVGGDQTAGANINIANGSTATIDGNQMAEAGYISVNNGSLLSVGGDQTAGTNINIADGSTATIGGNQTAEVGYISVANGSKLEVGGDQTAGTNINIANGSTAAIGGNQTAEAGYISVNYGSQLSVDGDQTASTNINLANASTATIDGNQTAGAGYISVANGSQLSVGGDQTAGTNINIADGSTAAIGGNQTAEAGYISVANSTLTVGGDQQAETNIAMQNAIVDIIGSQTAVTGDISATNGTKLTVGADQTAGSNIDIANGSTATVGGSQTAEAGYISVANGSKLEVGGDQTAGTNINIANGSTAAIGGNQTAEAGYISVANSALTVGGDQQAETNIAMQNATVDITGSQTAVTGDISADEVMLSVGGDQTAGEDIAITDSFAFITGNQSAETGSVSVDGSRLEVGGNQSAGTNIDVTNSLATVGGDQTAAGYISVENSTLTVDGNETAGTNIALADSTVTIDGDQTAENGYISVDASALTVGGNQSAGTNIAIVNSSTADISGSQTAEAGSIAVWDSMLHTGGDQTAHTNISLLNSRTVIDGAQTAETGSITANVGYVKVSGGPSTAGTYIDLDNLRGTEDGTPEGAASSFVSLVANDGNPADAHTAIRITDSELTVSGDVIAKDLEPDANGNINAIVIDSDADATARTDVTIGGTVLARDGSLTVGTLDDTDTLIGQGSDLHLTGTTTEGGTLIDVNIAAVTVNAGNTLDSLNGDVITARETDRGIGTELTVKGYVNGKSWTNVGSALVDGSGAETTDGVLLMAEVVNLKGANTVQNEGVICVTNDQGSIILDGTDVNGVEGHNTITNGVVVTQGKESTISLVGDENVVHTITESAVAAAGVDSHVLIDGTLMADNSFIGAVGGIALEGALDAVDKSSVVITDSSDASPSLIKDSVIGSTGWVSIASNSDQATTITTTGNGMTTFIRANGTESDSGLNIGIGLHNVNLVDLNADGSCVEKEVYAVTGTIAISGTLNEMVNTELSVKSGYDTDGADSSTILMGSGSVLKMHENSHFDGTLSSLDETSAIYKDGGDTLVLDYSARAYNGSIYANLAADAATGKLIVSNDGSDLVVNCDGLGADSLIAMSDSNLHFSNGAFHKTQDGVVTFGTIDTSADLGLRHENVADGYNSLSMSPDMLTSTPTALSYTDDGNTRAGFKSIGTIISADQTRADNKLVGTNLVLSENTLLRVDAGLGADSATPVADHITLTGTLDARGARVLAAVAQPDGVMPIDDGNTEAMLSINDVVFADQTTVEIVSAGTVASAFNEDVLYETHYDAETGTYQRDMKNMNAWVRTTETGAELVYSRNYRSAQGKDVTQANTANVLARISDRYNHTEGTLQASGSRMANLLDAFDYTRREQDALSGLTSVSGVSNTVLQHSVMDGSRHHLSTLRRWTTLPTETPATASVVVPDGKAPAMVAPVKEEPQSTVWATYTGGYDSLDQAGSSMGGYSRTFQGLQMGYSRQLNNELLLGLGLGYENAVARGEGTHFHGDSYFVDLYGSARTGSFNHRFSAGVGIHKFGTERNVYVNAPNGHSFSGTGYGDTEAASIILGYELSTDYKLTEAATLTPFVTLNYAYHSFNNLMEGGLEDAGLITEYDDIHQLELAIGARYAYSFGLVKDQAPATVFASAELKAELSDHQPTAESRFIGATDLPFQVKSIDRSPVFGEIGAGIVIPFAERWSGTISGSVEFGSDRNAVNGGIGVSHQF